MSPLDALTAVLGSLFVSDARYRCPPGTYLDRFTPEIREALSRLTSRGDAGLEGPEGVLQSILGPRSAEARGDCAGGLEPSSSRLDEQVMKIIDEFAMGLMILSKYDKDGFGVQPEHDALFVTTSEVPSEEDRAALEDLGWGIKGGTPRGTWWVKAS